MISTCDEPSPWQSYAIQLQGSNQFIVIWGSNVFSLFFFFKFQKHETTKKKIFVSVILLFNILNIVNILILSSSH